MKRRQTIILLAVLALTAATPLRAQYFDWVRTYQSTHSSGTGSPDVDNMVLGMDADSRGNVYFVGRCVRGAAINGEELLGMVNHHTPTHNKVSIVIVKMSPQGEMMWHKAVSCWDESIAVGQMQVVGDSVLVCSVEAVSPELPNKPTCWFDSIIQYPDCILPMDSVYRYSNAFVTLDLDGNLKEQHFLNHGFLDTLGVPLPGNNVEHRVAVKTMGGIVLHIDHDGNIIIGADCSNDMCYQKYRCDTCENPWQSVEYSVENGGVGAVRIMVDGRRSFFFYPENRPIKTNARLMKFSPHFDSLLEVRYLMQSRLDSPRTGLGVPGITKSEIRHITSDSEGNIYVVGHIDISGGTDTIVPIDSTQGLSLHLSRLGSSFLVKYDSHLQPVFAKQLDGGINSGFNHCVVKDNDLFVLGGQGSSGPDFHYDNEIMRDISRGALLLRLNKNDGSLISYGKATPCRNNDSRPGVESNTTATIAVNNNRVATQIGFLGNVAFAGDTIRVPESPYRGRGFIIWDYEGHQLKIVDYHAPHTGNKECGTLFTDSSLYQCGLLIGEATFGDTSFNVLHSNGYIARYVDTSFLHPYVHHEPVAVPPQAAAAEPFFTLSPNPTTGRVRVEIHTPSPLRGTPPNLGGEPGTCSLTVRDAAGHEVMHKVIPPAQTAVDLDLSNLPAGAYFVTLSTPTTTGTQRLVVR